MSILFRPASGDLQLGNGKGATQSASNRGVQTTRQAKLGIRSAPNT